MNLGVATFEFHTAFRMNEITEQWLLRKREDKEEREGKTGKSKREAKGQMFTN